MIEANGIAAFQRTVSKGISDSYLRWQGINATLALAQSPNTKIVIIGSGKDGLPIILGNDTAATGAAAQPGTGVSLPPTGAAKEGDAAASAPPSQSENNAFDRSQPARTSPLLGAGEAGTPTANDRSGAGSGSASAANKPSGSPSTPSGVDSVLSRIYGFVRPTESSTPLQSKAPSSVDRQQGAR
jgi:hypothetical protein